MRIWDIPAEELDRQHLLGEHRELHALWTILTEGKSGYRHHPETLRWIGKLGALFRRHDELVHEMTRRGYHHHSPLNRDRIPDAEWAIPQEEFLLSLDGQRQLLKTKAQTSSQ